MEWIEVSAATVDEAKEQALDLLGVHEDELEFEVLLDPGTGLIARLRGKQARIRARVKPVSREKPDTRRRRKGRDGGGKGDRPRADRTAGGSRESRPAATAPDAGARGAAVAVGAEAGASAPSDGPPPGRSSKRRRGGRSRSAAGGGTAGARATASADQANEEHTVTDQVSMEEQAAAAKGFMTGLVDAFGLDAQVTTALTEDAVLVDVQGAEVGLLIGPKGVTLQAIEELARAVAQRSAGGAGARLRVDVGGYRERRRQALAEFVRTQATEVIASGTERTLEPMAPPDRKVVHDTVAELEGVVTASVGEEPRRRVVIRPA